MKKVNEKAPLAEVPTQMVAQENKLVNNDFSTEALIARAIDQKVPVETMERLLVMAKEMQAIKAKQEFDRAMAKFQSECPTIEKTKAVHTNSGSLAYKYAPIESVVEQVKNALTNNGFSYSTNMEMLENGVKVFVKVTHVMGHSEVTEMTVPLGNKTQVMNQSQVVAAASTFAKRYAFLNAFGIMTGDEDIDGANIPNEQKRSGIDENGKPSTFVNPAYQVPPKYQAKPVTPVKLSLAAEELKMRLETAQSKDALDTVALDIDFKKSELSEMEIGKLRTAYKLRLDKLTIK
jgi:hypothetical protein